MSTVTKTESKIDRLARELKEERAKEALRELEGKGLAIFKNEVASAKNFEEARLSAQRFISKVNNARAVLSKSAKE